MKTSKRLLSFFLAVVMVVTTCSVGFTAFAAEKNKSIWSTSCEAEDAYETLNSLADMLPQLLIGIEAIGNPIYEKYAKSVGKTVDQLTDKEKEEVAANTTISDLLGVLQPTLINALAKTSQADYADKLIDSGKPAEYYDYLLKDDGSVDFFTLYGLCENYKDNEELSKESRDTLSAWYDELSKIADLDLDSDAAIAKLIGMYVRQDSDDAWYLASLARLKEFYNAEFFADIDEEAIASIKAFYPTYVKMLESYGFTLELDSEAPISETFPVFLYYYNPSNNIYCSESDRNVTATGWMSVMNTMYASLLDLSNTEVTFDRSIDPESPWHPAEEMVAGVLSEIDSSEFPAGVTWPFTYHFKNVKSAEDLLNQAVEQITPDLKFMFTVATEGADLPEGITDDFYAMVAMLMETDANEVKALYSQIFTEEYSNTVEMYLPGIADGVAIKYCNEINSVADIDALVAARMPGRELTDDELKELGALIYGAQLKAAECFSTGSVTTIDRMGYPITATTPDIVNGTAVADLFAEIIARADGAGPTASITPYNQDFQRAFYSKFDDDKPSTTHYVAEDGTPVTPVEVTRDELAIQKYEGGLPKLNYVDASFDRDKINTYLEKAEAYARTHIIAELFDITPSNDSNGVSSVFRLDTLVNYIVEQNSIDVEVQLTEEQEAILYGDYDLTGKVGTEIVNTTLNNTVGGIVEMDLIKDLLSTLLGGTNVNLAAALMDIWARLSDDAVKTLFELVPLLVTVIDSLLIPILVNDEDGAYDNFVGDLLPMLKEVLDVSGLMAKNGSYIGINKLSFDLNQLLPDLMHWLFEGAEAEGIKYYPGNTVVRTDKDDNVLLTPAADVNTADVRNYTVKDQDGNVLSRTDSEDKTTFTYLGVTDESMDVVLSGHEDAVFTYEMTYSEDVPYFTGIYIADKALKDAKINDLPQLLGKVIDDEQLATALSEVVYELATLFTASLDEFIASDRMEQATFAGDDIASTGLNILFTAIPQLFDIMEDLAAEKYGIDKDNWTYCYEGKIDTSNKVEVGDKVYNKVTNARIEAFKTLAGSDDPNRSIDVLDLFAEILVEDWMNAIVSLFNNVVATDNKISKNLPIIAGLLNALGGFGEQSIITDIVNSVFQLDRDSEYSFTFTKQDNGLTGLSKENAYFLITNVERLVEVVKNLIAHFNSGNDNNNNENTDTPAENTPSKDTSPAVKPKTAKAAKATSANYSSSDLSNAKDLIGNLDKMLSSLLSDSTLNGFSLSSTENIVAGLVSLLDKFLGRDVQLDDEVTTNIVKLVNTYLYFITGESENLTANGKKVDAKKVYTNNALTGLVVETYALIEQIADCLLVKFYDTYDNDASLKYNLLVEAIDGVISPDAIGIRLGDYADAQKAFAKYDTWSNMAKDSSRNDYKKLGINWGFKNGDKEGFYDGLAASLRLVTSILGVLLIDTGWYDTVLTPVLAMFCTKNGVAITSYKDLVADKNATGYYDETLIAILSSVSGWLDALLKAPASTLIKTIQGVAGFLDEKNTKAGTIKSVVNGVMAPITKELKGLGNIFAIEADNGLLATSPTLKTIIYGLADKVSSLINVDEIKLGNEPYTYSLNGNNIIPIVNSYLAGTGITLKQISWSKIYSSTPEAALVYVLEYVIETLLDNENLMALLDAILNSGDEDNSDVIAIIIDALKTSKLDAKKLLGLINRVLEVSDSPTLAYWTFASYLQELTENFKYPAGITKAMANQGVDALDNLVANIFPLLGTFGVDLGANDLQGIFNSKLFTNELLTTIATALYGALDGLDPTIKSVLASLGVVSSTKDVAKILTDTSYGKTFSSAANTIKAQSSWKNVKNINWGFTNGSSKAQQGFVNALVAILRPLDNVLAVFLNEGSLQLNNVVYDLICSLEVAQTSTTLEIGGNIVAKITYSMKGGVFTLKVDDAARELSGASTLKLDLRSLKNLKDLKIVGTNGYNSAIIPLLEAFKCSDVKTYSQYRSDVKNAKDNLLLDVLNPILGGSDNSLLNKLAAKPFATLTELLPNIAMYLDAHGLSQLINNLLAPVTGLIADVAKTLNINAVIEDLLGTDLGGLVSMLLGVDINLDITNLSTLNIEDLVIPIIRMVLAGSDNEAISNLKLYDIDWNALISLGTKSTYTSKATGADGKYLTGKTLTGVDNGKVLITVLRYIAKTLLSNMSTIKGLVLGIDAVKKNDIISSIVSSVFNTLSTASEDQLIAAIFYLVSSSPSNAFWDYTKYKTGEYEFAYPEGMNTDFLKSLPPMLDGLIGGLADLNDLIGKALFKDDLISSLVTGLYGAIEGVKVGDGTLTALLAQTDIDFSTANVADLLTDEAYGQKFEGPAAVIKAAGSWANVDKSALKWGVTDRDSFFHALVAALRPIYGVLDVLLNDAYLGLFDLVRIPGSNGYTSSIVPLMEAFSMYNIKTQYQYREDISKEYDAILLDIINPIWDKVEDILNAPLQTVAAVVPNLALFLGNDGLCQILDNLLTPISALADAIRPIVDLNDLLNTLFKALNFDLNSILGKIGVTNFSLDVYDLNKTLKPLVSGDALIPLINNVLGLIKIGGSPLGLKLNDVDWLKLASHGTTIISYSQAATYGARVYVEGDSSETLIAVLRYLIDTINTGDNFDKISGLIGGLLGDGVDESVSGMISDVLGIIQGDTDTVIASLVDMLEAFA